MRIRADKITATRKNGTCNLLKYLCPNLYLFLPTLHDCYLPMIICDLGRIKLCPKPTKFDDVAEML